MSDASAAGQGALDAASSGDASSPAPLTIHNVDILTHVPAKLDFDADNYAEWRDGMLSALAEFGAVDHVEEQGHSLHEGDEEWMRADVTIVLWIYTTISDELLDEVMAAHSTAGEVWAQLRGFLRGRGRVRPGPGAPHRRAGGHVRQRLRLAPQGAGPCRLRRGRRARLRHRAGPAAAPRGDPQAPGHGHLPARQ